MNGPQHFAAAERALENAHCHSGPRDDIDRFNRHMRLFEAHLAMAQFALDVARTAGAEVATASAESLSENTAAWITAITAGGAR